MANIGDGFKDIFFAGIGALAITGEKAKDVVDQLIAKGELTVDQGKQINSELTRKVGEAADTAQYELLKARMKVMSPEERTAFAEKAAQIAADINAQDVAGETADDASEDPIDVEPAEDPVQE
ncbi:MAG: hypothetical protein U0L71_05005 [Eggerthellaceae bacterium]|nr:hypothetical protein [Eggerthellaceae bacterium]